MLPACVTLCIAAMQAGQHSLESPGQRLIWVTSQEAFTLTVWLAACCAAGLTALSISVAKMLLLDALQEAVTLPAWLMLNCCEAGLTAQSVSAGSQSTQLSQLTSMKSGR